MFHGIQAQEQSLNKYENFHVMDCKSIESLKISTRCPFQHLFSGSFCQAEDIVNMNDVQTASQFLLLELLI